MKVLVWIIIILSFAGVSSAQWIKQTVDTKASLRGLSVVNEKVVWASGTGGTVIKTADGGATWKVITVPGAEKLDFRDIEAFDANTAYILSIGNGESSRIYKTTDGGATWKNQFTNKNEKAFFDAIACWDAKNCIAMSDPVHGRYVLIETKDGASWNPIDTSKMPVAKEGEAAFAASGTCLITQGKRNAFLVSGGTDARVFRSNDRGKTWQVSDTPMTKGTAGSGIFSIAMFDEKIGVIVGGNYEKPDERNGTFAMTRDGGVTWQPGARLNGYRSGVAYLDKNVVIAVGPSGTDLAYRRGLLWEKSGGEDLNAVSAEGKGSIWAVGPGGMVFRFSTNSIIAERPNPEVDEVEVPHPPNVTALDLSHSEISSKCSPSDVKCVSDRKVAVRTVAIDWDGPHEYVYSVTAGKVVGDGSNVEWDLSNVQPGAYTITVGISIPYLRGTRWGVLGLTKTSRIIVR